MKRIVQCVPNFSEGKDKEKIDNIIAPLKNQKGFKLISAEADKDYNRTVVTLIGDPEDMIEPLLEFFRAAAKHIDMNTQIGEHPRMGAVDVCPFIPIQNITMDECVDIAKKLGNEVYKRLNIPVFLYAEAQEADYRKELPAIRKGEFEEMKTKIKETKWHPDFGKSEIHPTFGVVAIGARLPLIAYNIDLDTDDQKKANAIAKAIRHSSGGFRYVQAGPAFLEQQGHMQVTMNILDFKKNPIYRIFETVAMEAKRYQIKIKSSEVVGLIPMDALKNSIRYYDLVHHESYDKNMSIETASEKAIKYLKLRDFDQKKIIEANL